MGWSMQRLGVVHLAKSCEVTIRHTNPSQGSEHNQNDFVTGKPGAKGYDAQKCNSCNEGSLYIAQFKKPKWKEQNTYLTRIINITNPSTLWEGQWLSGST